MPWRELGQEQFLIQGIERPAGQGLEQGHLLGGIAAPRQGQ
jgi:hypothetical protein